MHEAIGGAHRVDAGEEAAEPLQHRRAVELRRAAAAARIHGETEPGVLVQRAAPVGQRRDHRDLALGQLGDERVLLEDRGVAPALRAVELGDDRGLVVAPDLVDAVLVAAERQQAAVAAHAHGVEGVEHDVGRQRVVEVPVHRVILAADSERTPWRAGIAYRFVRVALGARQRSTWQDVQLKWLAAISGLPSRLP